MLSLEGTLLLEAPTGGEINISAKTNNELMIHCSDGTTARSAFTALKTAYPGVTDLRRFGRFRNPLSQEIVIAVDDREVVRWPSGQLPRVLSLRGTLKILFGR